MRIKLIMTALLLTFLSQSVMAQLNAFTDYDISKELWNVTMVKVKPNMSDDYLEGLRDTWIASNKVAKELGHIEDFHIFQSQVGASGDANLLLVVKFADSSQLEPNKGEYDKFMKAWGDANQDKSREIVKNYPAIREITGEYLLREITVK